jgi:hypothetical protein
MVMSFHRSGPTLWKLSARRHKKKVRPAPVMLPATPAAATEPTWVTLEHERKRELNERIHRLRAARMAAEFVRGE